MRRRSRPSAGCPAPPPFGRPRETAGSAAKRRTKDVPWLPFASYYNIGLYRKYFASIKISSASTRWSRPRGLYNRPSPMVEHVFLANQERSLKVNIIRTAKPLPSPVPVVFPNALPCHRYRQSRDERPDFADVTMPVNLRVAFHDEMRGLMRNRAAWS